MEEIPINNSYIILLIILLLCSAFFSSSETAFSSLNKIRLKAYVNNGNKRAEETLEVAENFSKLISTILVGNNIVNITSATLATVYFTSLIGEKGATVSTIVMTVLVILFGEVIPKSLAKMYPEKYAMAIVPIIKVIIGVFTPITFVFNKLSNLIESLYKSEEEEEFHSEELITMVEEAELDGSVDEHEAEIITNAIEFNDLDVGEIFTPRVDVTFVSDDDSMEDVAKKFRETGYSRLPYYEHNVDNIIGMLHEKDFYNIYYTKSKTTLKQILRDVFFTNENIKISALLRQLQKQKLHMAIVVDEYGGTAGIITMEDILEELVGEIYDEHDEIIEYFKKKNENTYIINCDADIEEMFEYLNIKPEEEYDYNTVSGWVIDSMDKIPITGESFDLDNMHVIITKANGKTVQEIKIILKDNIEE